MSDLKLCPFCGSEMKLETIDDVVTGPGQVFVQCDCGAMGSGAGTLVEAIAAWNRRAAPDALAMARRFLGWKLPADFSPDCGISFKPYDMPHMWPIGTNLFNEDQATAMFDYCIRTHTASTDATSRCGAQGRITQPVSVESTRSAEVDVEAERKPFEADFTDEQKREGESDEYIFLALQRTFGDYQTTYVQGRWKGWLAKARTQADAGKERELYNELLYEVARKFPGESRHETALRYIRAAEAPSTSTAQATTKPENT